VEYPGPSGRRIRREQLSFGFGIFGHDVASALAAGWYDSAEFPIGIIPRLAELGLFGLHLTGYGCPGRSAVG